MSEEDEFEIGFICRKGGSHLVLYADPEYDGCCGSKSIATITVKFDNNVANKEKIMDTTNEYIKDLFQLAYNTYGYDDE